MGNVQRVLDAEVSAYLKVEKKDGRVLYYKVIGEQNIEINEQEYKENNNG